MKYLKERRLLVCLLLASCGLEVESFDPITFLVSAGFAGYNRLLCLVGECCESAISPNMTGLREALTNRLHGQPFVKDTVLKLTKRHLMNPDPEKPLSLSFHGWTGSGKNFVAQMMVDHVFQSGSASPFVHLFVATVHFPHKDKVAEYQDNLRRWIRGNVSMCERTMFIFDEMDKMPNGLLNAIKPFLDTYVVIDGVNYRKTIFIFLSNTAGHHINMRTLDYWEMGKGRDDIQHKEMEELILLSSFNEPGGLWHSSLIEKNMISAFVPFLPLERSHVEQCVRDDMARKGYRQVRKSVVDKVLDELAYFPANKNVYSKSGCKRVPQKVDLILEEL